MSRQTITHDKHQDHLGQPRWLVEVTWETQDTDEPDGDWERHWESAGEYDSLAKAKEVGEAEWHRWKRLDRFWLDVRLTICSWVEVDEDEVLDAELEIEDTVLVLEFPHLGWHE